ncbi:high-potential iron-sulfur protein, partial [Photobacterium damselae]
QAKDGDEWRPCAIFPDKLVNANGWCSAYAPKPA